MPVSRDDVTRFRALHDQARPLIIANVWDAASAAIVRAAGAQAIATTSAGVAWALGYADGGRLPPSVVLSAVQTVKRGAGSLPLSVDLEGGYSDDPEAVARLAGELRGLGVCGINLEDGTGDPALLERKIAAIKQLLAAAGDDLFVNARIDLLLNGSEEDADALREIVSRARRYEAAGADGIFVPLLSQAEGIAAAASATRLPLNVLALPELGDAAALFDLGVRRISAGATIARGAFAAARASTEAFLKSKDAATLFDAPSLPSSELNEFFSAP